MLVNPTYVNTDEVMAQAQRAASALSRRLVLVKAVNDGDLDAARIVPVPVEIGAAGVIWWKPMLPDSCWQ
jgi:hypothetical protein